MIKPPCTEQLKKTRGRIVLAKHDLWPMSIMVEQACSDDETDHEDCQDELAKHVSSAVHIKKLKWRSMDLQHAFTRLDSYKGRLDSSTPKKSPPKASTSNITPTPKTSCSV